MAKGIYERKGKYGDITYYIRYAFKGTDVKEKIGKKSRGFTREVAKQALKSRLGDIAKGRFNLGQTQRPHTFAELADQYHKHAAGYKASYSREKYSIEKLKEYFGGRNLGDITTWTIEKWKREQTLERSPTTVNRELTILKHMLKMAVKWKLAFSNPSIDVSRFPTQEGRIRYLSGDELRKLLLACQRQVSSPGYTP